jgi:signal peptidase I
MSLRRAGGVGLALLFAALVLVAVTPILLRVVGYEAFVVQSDSMAPALVTGDAIVTESISPSSLEVGDVVTFADATRAGLLVTHRVTDLRRDGTRTSVVTRGDGNTAVERWAVDDEVDVGRLVARLPKLGVLVTSVSTPVARAALTTCALALLGAGVLRRIWS